MADWCATRPVDVARLNSGVFLAVLRKFAAIVAICAPIYFAAIVVLADLRAPQIGMGFVLGHVWLYFLTAFIGHLAVGLLVMTFATAVGSLVWWRHVLAVGGPLSALASLALATRRVLVRLAREVDPRLLAVHHLREHETSLSASIHDLLDELRVSLLVASDAPPLRLAYLADRFVRTDQLTSRRVS